MSNVLIWKFIGFYVHLNSRNPFSKYKNREISDIYEIKFQLWDYVWFDSILGPLSLAEIISSQRQKRQFGAEGWDYKKI